MRGARGRGRARVGVDADVDDVHARPLALRPAVPIRASGGGVRTAARRVSAARSATSASIARIHPSTSATLVPGQARQEQHGVDAAQRRRVRCRVVPGDQHRARPSGAPGIGGLGTGTLDSSPGA